MLMAKCYHVAIIMAIVTIGRVDGDGHQARLDETLDVAIGETATELDTRGFLSGSGETAFGNLLADAMRQATGSDIALSNGSGIRGDPVYPPGTRLTRKMVLIDSASGELMAGQLIDRIVAAGTVAPTIEGRIRRAD